MSLKANGNITRRTFANVKIKICKNNHCERKPWKYIVKPKLSRSTEVTHVTSKSLHFDDGFVSNVTVRDQ